MRTVRPLLRSFKYAARGIRYCVKYERNFRIHLSAAFFVVFFGFAGHLTAYEFAVLFLCFGIVILPEMINTSIETLSNLVTREQNEAIGLIKDIAAGAVFIGAICSAVVGGIIFFKREVILNVYRTITEMPLVGVAAAVIFIIAVFFIKGNTKNEH